MTGEQVMGASPLCPMCGAYSPKSCDLEDECGGVCPWVESGQHERDCETDDEERLQLFPRPSAPKHTPAGISPMIDLMQRARDRETYGGACD